MKQTHSAEKARKTVVITPSQGLVNNANTTPKSVGVVQPRVQLAPKMVVPARKTVSKKSIVVAAKKATPTDVEAISTHEKIGLSQVQPGATIELRCPTISRTCPIWALNKCIEQCPISPTTPRPCESEFTFCGYAGDALEVEYTYTATKLAPGSIYFSSGVLLTNNSLSSFVIITVRLQLPDNTTVTITTDLPQGSTVSTGESIAFNIAGLLPRGITCEELNQSNVLIQLYTQFHFNISAPIVIEDCNDVQCSCNTTMLRITDVVVGGEEPEILVGEFPSDGDSPMIFTTTSSFVVGNVGDATTPVTCTGTQTITNEASLAPVVDGDVCGPTVCPTSDSATVSINCVVPTVSASGVVKTTYEESWCVCKKGEFIPPCIPPPGGRVYSKGFYKNHGPTGECCDCHKGNNSNEFPESVQQNGLAVVGLPQTHSSLTQQEVCNLLQAKSGNGNGNGGLDCIASSTCVKPPSNGQWSFIISPLHQYITFLLNVEKLGGVVPLCIEGVYNELKVDLTPFFATYEDGVYSIFCTNPNDHFDAAARTRISSNAESLGQFNNATYEGCPGYIHGDEEQVNVKLGQDVDEPCCPSPLVKWTTDFSSSVVTNTTISLTGSICLPDLGCSPPYAKTFTVNVYAIPVNPGDPPVFLADQEVIISANSPPGTCVPFAFSETDLPDIQGGDGVIVRTTTLQETYATKTCFSTQSFTELLVDEQRVEFTSECVALTTSTIADTITILPPECATGNNPIYLPDCNVTNSCGETIIANTTFTAISSCEDVENQSIGICDNGFNTPLYALLANLIVNKDVIPLNDFLELFNINSCETPRCYSIFELIFYTQVPTCATSITNAVTVQTLGPDDSSNTSISTSVVGIPSV